MKILAIKIRTGDYLPKWYYGYSYQLIDQPIYVFYPIPLNFIIRWMVYFKNWWNGFRCKPNYLDRLLENRIKELNNKIKELRLENHKLKMTEKILFKDWTDPEEDKIWANL